MGAEGEGRWGGGKTTARRNLSQSEYTATYMSCLCLGDSFGIYSDRYGLRFCAGAFWTRVVFFPSSLYSVMFGTLIGILRYTLTKKDLLTFSELLRYFLEILLAFSRRSSKIPRGSFCFIPSCFSSGGRRRSKGRGRVKGIR